MQVLRIDALTGEEQVVEVPDAPDPVPEVVFMRQACLALNDAGLLSQVDAVIASLPSPQKEVAQIEWTRASEVRRDSATMALIGTALSLTEKQIDALFVAAAGK